MVKPDEFEQPKRCTNPNCGGNQIIPVFWKSFSYSLDVIGNVNLKVLPLPSP
jgi:hypothetical protein